MSFRNGSVILGGARTPMGRLMGSLSSLSATDLGAVAIRAALERSGVSSSLVDYVIMGQVLQAGEGQMPARQAAVKAGIDMSVPALSINKVCLSGVDAIALADQLVRAGEFDVVVAGGMESMSCAPHLLMNSRSGTRFGDWPLTDSMSYDALTCAYEHCSMGVSADRDNHRFKVSRSAQDEFAVRSHQRAYAAQQAGCFAEEIAPVELIRRKGDSETVTQDEGIRPGTSLEALASLRPAFAADGTITAASSSQISDGAAAVVVMSQGKAQELGLAPLAVIGSHGVVSGPDTSLHHQPANAIRKACAREGIDVSALDVVEINEAFAAICIASAQELGIPVEGINANGGAIALGHPVGMSGARLVLHVAMELKRRGGGVGAAALCGGGGQGDALLLSS